MSSQSGLERRTVHFAGHVQGVGFRYSTRNIARAFEVSGFVRNLADGRVQLVAEGAPGVLDEFIGQVTHDLGAYIRQTTVDHQPASSEFSSFEIRH